MDHEQMEMEKNKSAVEGRSHDTDSEGLQKSISKTRTPTEAYPVRRGRPLKSNLSGQTIIAGNLTAGVKDEILDYDDMYQEASEKRRARKYKISVPMQPRNANGTFAPCRDSIEEQRQAARLAAEKKLQQDDIIRIA